jgi:hypothetical protein
LVNSGIYEISSGEALLLVGLALMVGLACNFGSDAPQDARPGDSEAPNATIGGRNRPPPVEQPANLELPSRLLQRRKPTTHAAERRFEDCLRQGWQPVVLKEGQGRQLTSSGRVYLPLVSGRPLDRFCAPGGRFYMELWAINVDGTQEHRLVRVEDLDTIGGGVRDPSAAAVNPYHFEWIPDSHRLAFNTHQVFQGPGLALLDDLNVVDADSGEITYPLLSGWGGEFYYSPDGEQIAITTPSSVILVNADGSNYRKVLDYAPVNTYSDYRFYARPYWSADGASLRLALPPADPLARPAEPTTLWTITADGSTSPHQDGSVPAVAFFETPVVYSPGLERILYLQETGQPAENLRELLVATFDGQGSWVYEKGPMLRLESWATDGKHFTYATGENGEMRLGSLEQAARPFSSDPYSIQSMRWTRNGCSSSSSVQALDFYLATIDGNPRCGHPS